MPLQIRRGTNAERLAMTQALAQGEMLYVTDDQRLYIGNGTTLGGVQITGYTNEDAQDAVAPMFTGGTHSGISFAYNDASNVINATLDLSNYTGTINASAFKGTLVADDSTMLIDAVDGKINLDGTVKGNIIPSSNEAYDIGSASFRFKDLYLSGSSIKLGNATITASGTAVDLPVGSTINGEPITSFTPGQNLNVNIVGDDSTVLVNTATNTLRGRFVGDVNGSIFADDSSILVDSIDQIFYGTVDTGNTVIGTDSLTATTFSLGTSSSLLNLTLNLDTNLEVKQVTNAGVGRYFVLTQGAGTVASPSAVSAGDVLGGMLLKAYSSPSVQAIAGTFGFFVDSTATIAGGNFIKSKAIISASTDTGADLADSMIVDSAGKATSNAFCATKYFQLSVFANDAARSSAIPTPAQGMMVFMQSGTSPSVTNKTVVYDGSAWVALH